MKNLKTFSLVLIVAVSTSSFAAGNHAGGHQMNHDMHAAHWMAPPSEAAKKNPIKVSPQSIATGAQLFKQNCATCHGENADGKGPAGVMLNPKPADLRVMSGMHPDGDFAYKIKVGRGAMPSWKSAFNETQVWHLVNFIQTLNAQPVAKQSEGHGHSGGHSHAD